MEVIDWNKVGFVVLEMEKAQNPGSVVTKVKYPTSDTIYHYIRKETKCEEEGVYKTLVDGCEIKYQYVLKDEIIVILSVTRVYRRRRRKSSGEGESKLKPKNVVSKIKEEIAEQGLETPDSPETPKEKDPVEEEPENHGVSGAEVETDYENTIVHHEKYDTIKSCLLCGIPVYLAGPAGSGKNHTVEQIADELNWEFYFSNSVQQEYKLTGFIDAGGTYHETELYKACSSKKDCIFFLDEMDASIPEVLVLLNVAIANGYFDFPCGRVDFEHVHFVAAGNTLGSGADDLYTGRMVLDQATLDRFAIVDFGYDTKIETVLSRGNADLLKFVHQLRHESDRKGIKATFSYRCITMVTKLEGIGMELDEILKIAVVKGLDKDTINNLKPDGNTKYHKALVRIQLAA